MGCGSSSAATYPGNRRVAQPVYVPNSNEYKQIDANTAVAQAHFVTCPGGNALRLMSGARQAESNYIHPMEKVGAAGAPPTYISGERSERFILFVFRFMFIYLFSHFPSLRFI
jgi:hypothetical protein